MSDVQAPPATARAEKRTVRRDILKAALGALAGATLSGTTARAAPEAGDLLSTYLRFVTAQNAADLVTVRAMFTETPRFLWVSDGQSIWGRDAAIERMSLFRTSEIWHVTPDLDHAVIVPLDERTAYLHLPLDLTIGSKVPGPDRLPFLVSMLGLRARPDEPFSIAALFTTTRKAP